MASMPRLLRQQGPTIKPGQGPYPAAPSAGGKGAQSPLIAATQKLQPKLAPALQAALAMKQGAAPRQLAFAKAPPQGSVPPPTAGSAFGIQKLARATSVPPLGSGKIFR